MKTKTKTERVIRRSTMVGSVVAAYLLLTADYQYPPTNVLGPIKNAIRSAESSAKEFIFGTKKRTEKNDDTKMDSASSKGNP